ncbi:hypothetical protein BZG36_05662, partial [Bifiguratus adelaidae]
MVATIPAVIFIDKWGRRPTLISGAILMALCMAIVAGTIHAHNGGILFVNSGNSTGSAGSNKGALLNSFSATIVVIVFLYLFVACFAYSWGPCGWLYPAELYPQRVRAKAISMTTAANWLFNFAVGQLTPLMLSAMPWGTYVIFAVFCLIMALVVYKFFPETNGKSLEEVDLIFGGDLKDHELDMHHPQTAAGAIEEIEKLQNDPQFAFRQNEIRNMISHALQRVVAERDEEEGREDALSALNSAALSPRRSSRGNFSFDERDSRFHEERRRSSTRRGSKGTALKHASTYSEKRMSDSSYVQDGHLGRIHTPPHPGLDTMLEEPRQTASPVDMHDAHVVDVVEGSPEHSAETHDTDINRDPQTP